MVFEKAIVNAVDRWLAGIPPELVDMPTITIFVGGAWNTFTPNQIVEEVKAGTEAGEVFIERMLGINLEQRTP